MNNFDESIRQLKSSRRHARPQTFLISGCSSGIGLYACKLLAAMDPQNTLILVGRSLERAEFAKQEIQSLGVSIPEENMIPMECDHCSFESVNRFCKNLRARLGAQDSWDDDQRTRKGGIDVLCLNAAILLGEDATPQFTEDDIEITFQTNHLAPFLIANLIHDLLNPGGRVVITTSGLHTYATFGNFAGMTDPKTGNARKRFAMIAGMEFHHKQCYAASKLCNVAFCLELDRRLRKRNIVAVCFSPGLIPSSGLFRHQKNWQSTVRKKQVVGMDDTKEWGGCVLAWMAISDEAGRKGGAFWRAPYGISKRGGCFNRDLYTPPVCEEAAQQKNIEMLWSMSAQLTRISKDLIPMN